MYILPQKFFPFFAIFLLLAVFERVLSTFFNNKTKATQKIHHKWIFTTLFYSYILIVLISIIEHVLVVSNVNLLVSGAGILLFGCGVLFRRKAIADLGDNWSIFTEIKEGQELVTTGIYRVLRHPYYVAVFLELTGVCFVSNAYSSLMLVFAVQTPLLFVRVVLEERMLVNCFGKAYEEYKEM